MLFGYIHKTEGFHFEELFQGKSGVRDIMSLKILSSISKTEFL